MTPGVWVDLKADSEMRDDMVVTLLSSLPNVSLGSGCSMFFMRYDNGFVIVFR